MKGRLTKAPAAATSDAPFRVTANGITWELDLLRHDPSLEAAGRLAGRLVLATGRYEPRRGPAGVRPTLVAEALGAAATTDRPEYIDVIIEGTLRTGVVAIGGETTGTTIAAGATSWELELDSDQHGIAATLNGQRVVVEGELAARRGVEVKRRLVVTVRALKPR